MSKLASQRYGEKSYECQHPWPEDCHCQCHSPGLVAAAFGITEPDGIRRPLASFDALPRSPITFLHGEGASVEEAENSCWLSFQRIMACPGHLFDRGEHDDGYCICIRCSLKGRFLDPLFYCVICDEPTCYSHDVRGQWFCERHHQRMLEEHKSPTQLLCEEFQREGLGIEEPCRLVTFPEQEPVAVG